MIVVQKVCQRQLHAAVLGKGSRPGDQSGRIAVGSADIVQNVFGRFLFKLDVAAFGYGNKAFLDLPGHASGCVGEQRREFIFKVVFFVGLADEIQHGQAFFVFRQTQATAQLLQEDGQRLGGTQEKNGVDLGDIDALVVNIHNEDEAYLAVFQAILGGLSFLVGRFPRQEHGRDLMLIEIAAHELGVLDGDTEAESLYIVNVGHIFQQRRDHMIGASVCNGSAESVDIFQLTLLVAAGRPLYRIQIHRIGDAEILERAQELAVDGFGQADLCRNSIAEVGQHALSVHAFRRGGEAQQDERLVIGQQFLIGRRRRVVEFVHDDIIIELRQCFCRKILRVEGLNGNE